MSGEIVRVIRLGDRAYEWYCNTCRQSSGSEFQTRRDAEAAAHDHLLWHVRRDQAVNQQVPDGAK